jgi:hypothetical protein
MAPLMMAQDAAATPPAQASTGMAPTPAECGIPGHHALLERMSETFALTCLQEQKLEPLLHDEESVSKPLLAFAAFTPEEKKQVMLQVKVAARKQIRPLLTPEQQAKMDQEIDTVSKGGDGLQKGNGKSGGSGKSGGAKGSRASQTGAAADAFEAEESLCTAISKYSAFSDKERNALVLKVKQAALRPDAPAMTPDEAEQVRADIKNSQSL